MWMAGAWKGFSGVVNLVSFNSLPCSRGTTASNLLKNDLVGVVFIMESKDTSSF